MLKFVCPTREIEKLGHDQCFRYPTTSLTIFLWAFIVYQKSNVHVVGKHLFFFPMANSRMYK